MSVETIRSAYEALAAGDVEPLAALLDADVAWRGRRGLRLWRSPPS